MDIVNKLRFIIKSSFRFLINKKIIYFFVFIYKRLFEDKIIQAAGRYHLSLIKNKGENCRFLGKVTVYYDDGLILGNHIRIGSNCFIFAMGGVEIGDNTQISRNVTIYSANHNINGTHIPYDENYICKPVTIGHSVWIGMNAQILPGVTIEDGAIIGMGAIVSKNVKAGEIVVSSPQRVVKFRNMDEFLKKKEEQLFFAKSWPER